MYYISIYCNISFRYIMICNGFDILTPNTLDLCIKITHSSDPTGKI